MTIDKIVETMARGIRPGAFEEGLTEFGALCIGHNRADAMRMAAGALSALEAAGLVVVPIKATPEMLANAEVGLATTLHGIYSAMISAAIGEKGSDNA